MAKKKSPSKQPPLEAGFLQALHALDQQVAREMQRSPEDREQLGVLKWGPYQKRMEELTAFLLTSFGEGKIQLDSLFISTQALVKALSMLAHDLGEDGLGTIRSGYCHEVLQGILRDCHQALQYLEEDRPELV